MSILKSKLRIPKSIHQLCYWNFPDKAYALFFNIYGIFIRILVVPSGEFWLVLSEDMKIFIPSPKEAYRINSFRTSSVVKKYSLEPFVLVEKGDVVVDVGAYIGEFTIPVAFKAKKVIAVEPDPRNFKCLKKNVECMNLRNVICVQKAAYNRKGFFNLNLGKKTADSSLIEVTEHPLKQKIKVETDTLDNIIAEIKLRKIDLIKIDAEGAEPEVLQGAENCLEVASKVVVDSSPERYGKPTTHAVIRILEKKGFYVSKSQDIVFAYRRGNILSKI